MPTLRPSIKLALISTFWAVFLLGHFTHLPIAGFSDAAWPIAIALLTAFAAFGWGAWPIRGLLPQVTASEHVIFSMGLGWACISGWVVLGGLIKAWVPTSAYLLIAVGTILGLSRRSDWVKMGGDSPAWPTTRWLCLIVPAAFVVILLALAPPTYYDSLVYHLALPAAYIRAGHWIGWTDLIYSAFPQNLEMLWTFGLLTGFPSMPGLIGALLAALLLCAMHQWCRRTLDAQTGATAVVFLLLMPAFVLLNSGGYVDVGLALYFFLSFYALSLSFDNEGIGPTLTAGIFAGFATGIKYTGILSIAIGLLWILWRSPPKRARRAMVFVGVATLMFMPWMVKNLHYYGNPVFPFFYTWGNAALNPWSKEAAEGYFRALVEYQPHSLLGLPALLWQMAVNGFDFGKGADVLGDFGWALCVAFLPLMLLATKNRKIIGGMAFYCVLFFGIWGMTRPVLRFLMPIAPFFAILGAFGWTVGRAIGGPYLRRGAALVCGLLIASNVWVFFQITDVFKPFSVPLGLQSKESYLTEKLTYYGAAAFINKSMPRDAAVVVVGDQRSYYYDRKVWLSTVFNPNPIVHWADTAPSPAALRSQLRARGSLLVVNRLEQHRLAPYHVLDFSASGRRTWDHMLGAMRPIYSDHACDVYAL